MAAKNGAHCGTRTLAGARSLSLEWSRVVVMADAAEVETIFSSIDELTQTFGSELQQESKSLQASETERGESGEQWQAASY